MAERNPPYRVIQWATGNVGSRAMRMVIEHPDLELVGLWVSSAEKVGRDAGEFAGTAATGIKATNSAEDLIATDADCVLYMRKGTDYTELARLLASGKNVVTTTGDFHHVASVPQAHREQIEQACRDGGTSLYDTGSSPGFVTEALPIVLLSISRRLDCLTIDEYGDVSSRNSPDMLFNVMGYGRPSCEFDQHRAEHLKAHFATSLSQLAEAHGIAIERWEAFGEYSPATNRTTIAAGTIEAGHTAAQRITIQGVRAGKPVLRIRLNWYCTREIGHADWDLRESGWRIRIEGDTPLDVSITYPVAPEDYAAFTPGLTAHRPVNAIASVIRAEPGIRTTVDLPQVIARL
ncbi:MAG: dihydrodipicolinate reductase [Novosphingobium sp.]